MRTSVSLLAAAAIALTAATALGQTALKPDTPSLLVWRGDQQASGYRTIETIYKTHCKP